MAGLERMSNGSVAKRLFLSRHTGRQILGFEEHSCPKKLFSTSILASLAG